MVVACISVSGQEYLYNAKSAHAVPKANAQKVVDILNAARFKLSDGQTWYLHDVGMYDNAFYYAQDKRFTYGKGGLVAERFTR